MLSRHTFLWQILAFALVSSLLSTNSYAELSSLLANNSLIKSVTQSLNIQPKQAAGGVGSILRMAQDNTSSKDFGILKEAIPNVSQLLDIAPKPTSGEQSDFSKFNSEGLLGGLGSLTSQFATLGLSSDMIAPMVNAVLGYLKGNNSSQASDILQSAMPDDLFRAAKSLINSW